MEELTELEQNVNTSGNDGSINAESDFFNAAAGETNDTENDGLTYTDDSGEQSGKNELDVNIHVEPTPPTPPAPSVARLVYSAYSEMRPAPGTKYAPLGLFGYIGLLLLTSIPAVGLISSMVIALCAKRAAVQRFALAVVILRTLFWLIAAAAVAVAVYAFDIDVFGLIGKYFTLIRDAA